MNKAKTLSIFFGFLFSLNSFSYIHSVTKSGKQIKWASGVTLIDLYLNPTNTQSLNTTNVNSIVNASVSQWNSLSSINATLGTTAGTNQSGLNEIFFTTDSTVFSGTGVVGVTQVSYKEADGVILEADILINDGFTLSTTKTDSNYLGNVITHEMGHFFGLSHGQVTGSTMFYALSLGQSEIENDDKAGIYSIYPNSNSSKKSITGKVIGSTNLYGVFGAHVQAISQATGNVMGATISNTDGTFEIMGLPTGDKYFLYTQPVVQIGIPTFYSTAKTNFCDSSTSYRGSFYQACGGSHEGYPQAVALSSSSVDVGNVTIRCSLDVPPDYMIKKSTSNADFTPVVDSSSGYGNAFVGYFSSLEMNTSSTYDSFTIDLTSLATSDWNALSTSDDLYLEVQVVNQSFYSPFKANVSYTRSSATTSMSTKYVQNSDGWVDLNTTVRIPIDKTTSSTNSIEIKITPEKMNGTSYPSGIPFVKSDVLPAYSDFQDSLYFYFVNAHIVKLTGTNTYTNVSAKNYTVGDNSTCADAVNTYQLSSYATGTSSTSSTRSGVLSCGTISDISRDDNHSGPFGMMVGFSISFLIIAILRKLRFV
jgi:hypothetical protein